MQFQMNFEVKTEPQLSPEWSLMWQIIPWIVTPIILAVHLHRAKVSGFIVDLIKMMKANSELDDKVRTLALELAHLKTEQSKISQVNEFAAYFKKDRQIIKLQEQYDEAVRVRSSATSSSPILLFLSPLASSFTHIVVMLALQFIPQPTVACVPAPAFWPLNGLLSFPAVWSSSSEPVCEETYTGVSLIVLLYLAVVFYKRVTKQ